jgi:hypothetical protein
MACAEISFSLFDYIPNRISSGDHSVRSAKLSYINGLLIQSFP